MTSKSTLLDVSGSQDSLVGFFSFLNQNSQELGVLHVFVEGTPSHIDCSDRVALDGGGNSC